MNDLEKSLKLAKLCGWFKPAGDGYLPGLWKLDTGGHHLLDGFFSKSGDWLPDSFDLYDPANITLAWRVLNWASEQQGIYSKFMSWWFRQDSDLDMLGGYLFDLDPGTAQRAWLDTVYVLAFEAGLTD